MTDGKKLCCQRMDNLATERKAKDLVVKTCQVCGCRHFELEVDPAKLGVVFK